MNKKVLPSLIVGFVFIFCGLIWLLTNLEPSLKNVIGIDMIWPVFLLIPAVILWGVYLTSSQKDKDWGVLIPANIFLCLSVTFFINIFVVRWLDYEPIWAWTVFMYPGSVALAFLLTGLVTRKRVLLIPAMLTGFVSLFTLCFVTLVMSLASDRLALPSQLFLPAIIIFVGIMVLISPLWDWVWRDYDASKRWTGKTQQEWDNWGDNLGKNIENWVNRAVGADAEVIDGEEVDDEHDDHKD